MIRIFDKTDTTFANNGDVVVKPLKAIVHKEDNGSFYLDLSVPLEYADYMKEGRIVVVPTPQGHQGFRIHNPEKTHKRITTRARHLFYDTENYLIEDSYVDNHTCNYALNHLNDATEPTSEFTVISDVSTVNSFRCVRKSLYEAIQTVLERWGGHLVRNNFNIEIRTSIGQDNGVTIRYAKNLKEITCQEDWSTVVTQLMPVGYDGILLNSLDESVSPYITSSVQYAVPYTKTVSFTQDIDPDDYETETEYQQALIADLRQQATEYITEHCVPKVNYKLSANVEKISDVGDIIEVIDERLGINIMTNVISYDYDCILGKYTQIEFGNFTQNTMHGFASLIRSTMTDSTNVQIQEASAVMSDELKRATDSIIGMMNDSYVIYDGNQILVVDRLPKEQAVNVIRINSGGIGFSNTGITGTFNSAWLIDGTLDMQAVNVINLSADLIKAGVIQSPRGGSYWNLATGELHIEGDAAVDKSKVFTHEPTVPYYVGDLWVTAVSTNTSAVVGYAIAGDAIVGDDTIPENDGQIRACKTSRTTGSFNANDWELITNYIDTNELDILNQRINSVEVNVSQYDARINAKAESIEVTSLGNRVTTAELAIDANRGEISSKVARTEYNGATVASLINQSADSVKILANHVDIQGTLTVSAFDANTQASLLTGVTTKQQYYLSTSSSSTTGGSWSDAFPTWVSGKYIWTRTATTKTNVVGGSITTYSAAQYDKTLTTALSTANTTSTNLANWCYNNNITLINGGKIATGTITANQIAANAITGAKIAANTITADKISVTDLQALGATIAGWTINTNSIYNGFTLSGTEYNAIIYKGTQTSQTAFAVRTRPSGGGSYSYPFIVRYDGSLTATNANITGTINATSGSFGSGSNKITISNSTTNSAIYYGTTSLTSTTNGFYLGTDGISLGGGKFKVTSAGALTATNANITGTVTSTSGTIGGWTINTNSIYNGFTLSGTEYNAIIYKGTQTSQTAFAVRTRPSGGGSYSYPFIVRYDGSLTATNANITGTINATSGSFTGEITATSGNIAGFTLNSSQMQYGTWGSYGGMLIKPSGSSSSKSIAGSDSISGWALTLGANFGVTTGGIVYAKDVRITGGSQEIGDGTYGKFSVSKRGELTATGADISGAIYADSGEFNGAVYASSGSFNGTVTSSNAKISGGWIDITSGGDSTVEISWGSMDTRLRASGLWVHSDSGTTIVQSSGVSGPSDRRLKTEIKPLAEKSAEFIYALKPVSYKFKADTELRHHGFIAQDVEALNNDKEWAIVQRIFDTKTEEEHYMMSYTELIADLVATVQSLNKRIEALEGV